MLGWKIFAHSVRMVFGNLKQVLQITFGPALVATLIIVGLVLALGVPLEVLDDSSSTLPEGFSVGAFMIFILLVAIVMLAVAFWIAVSWHRFILLEEYPSGIFPTFRFDRILAYFGRVLLLGLVMIAGYLPLVLVLGLLGKSYAPGFLPIVIVYAIFLMICFYRLSIILPSAAIGEPIGLAQAWNSTTGTTGHIVILLIVAMIFQILVQLVFAAIAIIPIFGVLLSLFFGVLILPLINVSILTTMYGVFIEKRELS